jgi:hypothetical protein
VVPTVLTVPHLTVPVRVQVHPSAAIFRKRKSNLK